MSTQKAQLVAIVGRPNVGKSALFNRIVGRPIAIVEDHPGVTRDRHFAKADWAGQGFWLVDTGGFEPDLERGENTIPEVVREGMRRQVRMALEEAQQVIFVVDAKVGLHPLDKVVAGLLRGAGKPVILAANKVDVEEDEALRWEFSALGAGEPTGVSALHGRDVDVLLDRLVAGMDPHEPEDENGALRVAVIGRPNVGKSSLVNAILGEERSLVSTMPGTTRDAVDTPLRAHGRDLVLVDTAGLRQKGRIADEIERYSVVRTLRAIEGCDVALLLVDAYDGVNEQDERIAGLAHEAGRACVVVVNKWDLVAKDNLTFDKCRDDVRQHLKFMDYAPIVFISALTGQRLGEVLDAAIKAGDSHARRISTGLLNRALEDILSSGQLPSYKGRALKVYYLTQTGTRPPALALFVNEPKLMHFSTQRRIKKQLRERFDLEGTPLVLMLRKRS